MEIPFEYLSNSKKWGIGTSGNFELRSGACKDRVAGIGNDGINDGKECDKI
jgi:hypothetical protein